MVSDASTAATENGALSMLFPGSYFEKKLTVSQLCEAIELPKDHEIYMDLSFIVFNSRATVKSLDTNLCILEKLWEGARDTGRGKLARQGSEILLKDG